MKNLFRRTGRRKTGRRKLGLPPKRVRIGGHLFTRRKARRCIYKTLFF